MKRTPIILKGKINDIEFEYVLKSKEDHKQALKDMKSFAGKMEKTVKEGSPIYKVLNRYQTKTIELEKQTKELEKQLKYSKRMSLISGFETMIKEQIHAYKDWDIENLITDQILNTNRYGGSLRRLISEEVRNVLKEEKRGV